MKVAFVVNDLQLSGGIGVVVHHARELADRHGFDVRIVLARPQDASPWRYERLTGLRVSTLADAQEDSYEIAVSTWWETAGATLSLRARRHASFIQSLEDRFYLPRAPERIAAQLAVDLPVSFITEARWIQQTLTELHPEAPCYYVRNGIDKDVFPLLERVEPRLDGPLRILVEGMPSVWFKGVGDAITAAAAMREPRHVTVVSGERPALEGAPVDRVLGPVSQRELADLYSQSDLVLKLSRVEGMFGPPLEGFHRGATCVVTPVTGHDEFVEHGWNGLVCDWDDLRGVARLLDGLARDRRRLHFLRCNALETARGWPSWEQSTQAMALALWQIARRSPPQPTDGVGSLLADVRGGLEALRAPLRERDELAVRVARVEKIRSRPLVARALAIRRTRAGRAILRVARPVLRRLGA